MSDIVKFYCVFVLLVFKLSISYLSVFNELFFLRIYVFVVFPLENGKSRAIGIDLGTTYSCVGVWKNGGVEIITNDKDNRTTPSCISFTQTEHLIGDAAKHQMVLNAANTVYGAKRLIGKSFHDATVQHDIKLLPFKVVAGPYSEDDQRPMVVVTHKGEEKQFSAEEISAMVLMKMKEASEFHLGSKVTDAVITVPAYFNDAQRQATKDAGGIAGLNVIRLIEEPVAAAVAYAFNKLQTSIMSAENILIFDFGGATLDVSLLTIDKDEYAVKAIAGNAHLGGDDIDDRMVKHFVGEFKRKHGKDMSGDSVAVARLRSACERAKRKLSFVDLTNIEIDCLFESIDFFSVVTRELLENLNLDLFRMCMDCVTTCLQDGKMKMSDIDNVVLAGGSSRIPKVQQMLQDLFKGKQLYNFKGIINPDEAVAYGAAILSEMLTDNMSVAKLKIAEAITPSSLGIRVYGGGMSVVVPKCTALPVNKTRVYTTVHDNQKIVRFAVFEGENSIAEKNKYLDEFNLTGIPAAPAGTPNFDVYFDIDRAGILTVSAEHRGTTIKKQITIKKPGKALLKIELKRMIEKAKMDKVQDKPQQMKLIKTTNNFQKFAGTMMKCFRKTVKQISVINCFDIRN